MENKSFTLISRTVAVSKVTFLEKQKMYVIFQKYYFNVSFDQFQKDLLKKDVVFLLLDKKDRSIQGFSTLVHLQTSKNGQTIHGAFSGDTIIEKEYWGQKTLGKAFLKYLFLLKLKRPFSPLYWFLISKGYKTYLLMANNFKEYYPRFDQEIPPMAKNILDAFGTTLYPDNYQSEKGLIEFNLSEQKDCLKDDVAPITEELIKGNPKIAFFAQKNPDWKFGTELACLAKMTWSMPFFYFFKAKKRKEKTLVNFQEEVFKKEFEYMASNDKTNSQT